jgi:hypothetical protein
MSITTLAELTRHGRAHRATVIFGDRSVQFENLAVWLDTRDRLAHLLDADLQNHLATVPLDAVFVEWRDLTPIQPTAHVSAPEALEVAPW